MADNKIAKRPTDKLRELLDDPMVQDQFKRAMAEHADTFMASIIELVSTDSELQKCQPGAVIREAMKAATLDVPLNKALGFAYILPFRKKEGNDWVLVPTFIPGYKLFIQLALRTHEYKRINTDCVREGQAVVKNTLTGDIVINGTPTGDRVIGYCAYFELTYGFSKSLYMTRDEVFHHGETYSKSFDKSGSPWKTEFDAMAMKTVLKRLISTYGPLSVRNTLTEIIARDDEVDYQQHIDQEANTLTLEPVQEDAAPTTAATKAIDAPF